MTLRKITPSFRDQVTKLLRLESKSHWRTFENQMGTHTPTVRDAVEREMHADSHQIKLHAVWALAKHDFVDTLAAELAKGITLMLDIDWWDRHGFDGFTEHKLHVAGMARALSEAMSISQDVDERDDELPDDDTPIEPPTQKDPELFKKLVADTVSKLVPQET